MKKSYYGYLNLFLAMAISGSAVVVNKIMVNTISAFLAAEIGIIIGLVFLLIIVFGIKKEHYELDKKTIFILILQSVLGIALYRIFTFYGLKYTSAAESGLITSSSPAIVCILTYFILKEKIEKNCIVGLALIILGLLSINLYTYFTSENVYASLWGNLLISLAVICEALFLVISKIKVKEMSPIYRTTILVFIAAICLMPFAVNDLRSFDIKSLPFKTIVCLIYYGVFVTYLSYIFWFNGIAIHKANVAALFTSVVPLSSIILARLILKENISVFETIGMIFIVCGIIFASKNKDS